MTRRPDPSPQDDALILDGLRGELDETQRADFEARLAADPAFARARDAWERLSEAEHAAHEPAAARAAAEADAPRLAAWIRSTVAAEETARTRVRFRSAGERSWSRVLAWSVGLHVVVLGVLALVLGGQEAQQERRATAHVALEGEREWEEALVDPAETALAFRYERIEWDDLGAIGDRLALGEPESLQDELRADLESLADDAQTARRVLSHPVGVVVAMSRRKNGDLKRRRLDLLGFNAGGTLKAVDRGLRYLGRKQRPDGSFPATAERSDVEQTALTLLAFLGDGHTSRGRSQRDQVVQRGVAWLRKQVLERGARHDVRVRGDAAGVAIATVALCEDYMLSYGDLAPKASLRRADEIAALSVYARERSEKAVGNARTWAIWALDAAARSGVVTVSPADQQTFRTWVAGAAVGEAEAQADPMGALSTGTALLFSERGAAKPRFLRWSHSNAERLVSLLDPTGRARSGDTALILLALQVAYRTY